MFERLLSGLLAPCCTAALLSCVPGASGDVPGAAAPLPDRSLPGAPVANSAAIEGQWDIASFRGYAPRRLSGTRRAAFADFGSAEVVLQIECNASGVMGAVRGGRFVSRPGDRIQTLVGCGPEREARDAALFGFFDRNPVVEQLPDGRLRLTAGSDTLVLERPPARRLAFLPSPQQLLGEWRLLEITRYQKGGGTAGIGLSELPGRIEFDGISARYSLCPQFALRYRYAPEGRLEKLSGAAVPNEPRGCGTLEAEPFGRDMPRPWDVIRTLHANPLVELVDEQTILLSTERFGVLLTKRSPES